MSGNAVGRAWRRVREQFYKQAGHPLSVVIEDEQAPPLVADKSYVRVWLSEFYLATERSWGFDRKPAVKASVRLLFSRPDTYAPGRQALDMQTFAILVKPPVTSGHGVFEDYPITEWLPYQGKPVELEAALYAILGENRLLTAVDVLSEFASLVTPPVSAALTVADKVATGIEKVIKANGTDPKLPMHKRITAAGWLAVVDAREEEVPSAELHVNDAGRLCRNGQQLTGHDFLVLRVEACEERDDWRAPDLVAAINAALYARDVEDDQGAFWRLREEALRKTWFYADFTSGQRKKAAKVVEEELADPAHGVVGVGGMTLAEIVARRGLPSDNEVEFLTLDELIAR